MRPTLTKLLFTSLGCTVLLPGMAAEPTAAPAQATADNATLRAFQPKDFELAFDVLVSTSRLEEAFRVAEQAVRQLPQNRAWRRKLARVTEWTGRLALAAEQWKSLFALGDRSDETLAGLLRLAPVMDDPAVALQAWAVIADRGPLTDARWSEIYWLYENSSEPSRGSRFFETQYRAKHNPELLGYAARLAAHAGEDARAQALYLERVRLAPFSMDALLQAVFGHIQRDQWEEAFALMQSNTAHVPDDAAEFWRLLGQVAWELREYAVSEQAYLQSARTPNGEAGDWTRLVFLARQKNPQAAAKLAMEAYRRFGTVEQLQQALNLYAELGEVASQARVYGSLTPQQLALAEQNAQFLLGRAQFHQNRNQAESAWKDLRRARQLAPQDEGIAQAVLWFLINEQRRPELAQALNLYRQEANDNPDYWPLYAAGHQTLGRHREAIAWYRKAIRASPQDALLLLNFADALDQVHQAGMADRVRRQAWLLVKERHSRRPEDLLGLGARTELQAWARLALRNQSGEPGQELAHHLARQLRGITADPAAESQIDALLLGWAALKEQPANARAWLFMRYVRQSRGAPPLWAEAMVAQQQGDTEHMERLLDRHSRALSPDTRYELAMALGQTPLALDTAQQGMNAPESAEAMHERFRQQAPLNAHYVQLRAFNEGLDVLERQGTQLEARWVLNPTLHAVVGWSRVRQSSTDPDYATLLPGTDKLDSVEMRWLGPDHENRLALLQRSGLDSLTGMRLHRTARLMSRLEYEAGLDYRNESILSLPLRAAGYEHSLYADLTYNLDKRSYARIAPRWSRYYTQYHDDLGSGRILELEAGHRLRTEYPDWRVRVYSVGQDFSHGGPIGADNLARLPAYLQTGINSGTIDPADYFVPQSNTTVGACIAMGDTRAGQSLQTGYSRAWLPFLDLCLRHNSLTGDGYTGLLGMAGSLSGSDHLAVQWQGSDVSVPGSTAIRSFSIRYRHYY